MDDDLSDAEREMLRVAWQDRPDPVYLFSGEQAEEMAKTYRDRGEHSLADAMLERADVTTAVALKQKGLGSIVVDINGEMAFRPSSAGLIQGSKEFEDAAYGWDD